jgi:hypothetical protein
MSEQMQDFSTNPMMPLQILPTGLLGRYLMTLLRYSYLR